MSLDDCIESCSNLTDCHVFHHVNIGQTSECFLFGYDDEKGSPSNDICANKVGSTCCEKGEKGNKFLYLRSCF